MRNNQFPSQTCSVARALEIVGEWWTLLIIREAFFGARRFGEFERNLGVAKNVLSERLSKLVACGVMERIDVPGRGNPRDYRLTEKGRDLFPVLVALMQWGDRWAAAAGPPLRLLDPATGAEIAPLRVTGSSGAALEPQELLIAPGPGADEKVRRRFPPASEILPR
ncbi:HxlR family transcriptional regulator [Methylosinus sp. sav-2]|jgi:DNA-binding HxlR family transcriptional regulator|uniref:winged helix-turn-helix transcriptional regulator n=1 Tax=Methylosinus sp. sav-2 TaxID=2485168 RepID=UPI00047B37A0|nr:helix-turn-helix domain-containing protein [Methylosinus sp. sav-2]TDX66501.1 HxlR family transcriptional regulator [Methylosinus sp. sav-2]